MCFGLLAQSAQKSSGVVKLNMKKPAPARSETMPVAAPIGNESQFTWISPTLSTVKTSKSTFHIEASINSKEAIRFVNIFNNGQYITNKIPPVSSIRQLMIEEDMELALGKNNLKIEAVTVSGKKIESSVEVIYDISSAKYYALIIAVEDYDDPEINDLEQPLADATKFSTLLNKEYNFERENITFLRNPTKADIIGTLHQMRDVITPEDNLLIYYAGHGWWDEEMETGYWLPKNATRSNPVDWIPNTDLTNYLNVLKSKHTLLIADACFSGGIFVSRAAFNNVGSVEKLYKLTSRKAMTSGTLKEVPDKSVFIEYLIKRLDNNRQKYLPSEELYSSMREAVINNSPNVPRYGTIQNVGDEGGDFIFIRRD
jgi:hypothetical protein